MTADPRLKELVKRWRELRRTGSQPVLEELCRDCPELLTALREHLQEGRDTPSSMAVPTIPRMESVPGLDGPTRSYHDDTSPSAPVAQLPPRDQHLTPFQAALLAGADVRGTILGEYTLLEQLGAGGMGVVFKALHRRMNRLVAVKLLSRNLVDSPEAIARFQREVHAAARLSHPNIVTAYDAGEHERVHFLVMEFVAGTDLAHSLRRHGPLPPPRVIDCVMQAARALEYAHAQGVVHRDVKPGNLLLTSNDTVKVLDLGLARLRRPQAGDDDRQLTVEGATLGTPDYTAPEQYTDPTNADERADIYSLGCTLFTLLTGRTLYDEKTLMNKMLAHRERPIPSLRERCPDASPALESVFRRMVAKAPRDRYASMTAVLAALESCRLPATIDAPTAVLIPEAAVVPPPPRRWGWAIGTAAACTGLLLLAACTAFWGAGALFKTHVKGIGTVIVEVDQPGTEVIVDGKQISISDPDGGAPIEVKLEEGKHEMKVTRKGFETSTREFVVKKDGMTKLKVWLEPLPNVGITGKWLGVYLLVEGNADNSPLDVLEEKDGSLSGRWEGAALKGKRTGKNELQWDTTEPHVDGYWYHADSKMVCDGEVLRVTFRIISKDPNEKNLGQGTALLVRTPSAPVTKRVEFAGKWNGLYKNDNGAGGASPLDLKEDKDGTLTGVWDNVKVKGKRTGDATFELSGTTDDARTSYKALAKATNGGRVLQMSYTTTYRNKQKLESFDGLALMIREE